MEAREPAAGEGSSGEEVEETVIMRSSEFEEETLPEEAGEGEE